MFHRFHVCFSLVTFTNYEESCVCFLVELAAGSVMLGKQFVSLTVSPAHRVSPAEELENSELVLGTSYLVLSRSWKLGIGNALASHLD